VRRGGPYQLVRHPMYSGYVVTQLGFLLLNPSLWNAAVYALAWTTLVMRIGEEEKFLSQDIAYRDYQADVRYRLIPGIY
jgi:protein-S-isoprenylcysteine O-methyltransferase Ste14